jgi:hypothetical protein
MLSLRIHLIKLQKNCRAAHERLMLMVSAGNTSLVRRELCFYVFFHSALRIIFPRKTAQRVL